MISDKSYHDELMIAAFNHCAEVIIIINEKGKIIEANQRLEEMFEHTRSQVLMKPLHILFPDEFRERHKEHLKHFFAHPAVRSMGKAKDLFGKRRSGMIFPVEVSLSHFSTNGEKFGIAFVTDVSARKASEQRLEATIETAVDGICTIDDSGKILHVNQAICVLFGYSENELIGQGVEKLMPRETSEDHNQYMKDYLGGAEPRIIGVGRDVLAKKKNGEQFPIRLSIGEFKQGNERFFTGIIHDMTGEWKIKKQLRKLNNELEERVESRTKELADLVIKLEKTNSELEQAKKEANIALEKERELSELKSRFVSMASHEFRTPLSTILSSTILLKKYDGDEPHERKEKHYGRIKNNVTNLTNVLDDFLSLDKLESGVVKATKKEFHLKELVEEIIDELSSSFLKSGQHINFDFRGHEVFFSDPKIFKNILINLVSNASKYSRQEDTIELSLNSSHDKLELIIEDHGIGIPEEDQKHLFKRFFRANNAINIKGTGLGLNIVKKYVELLDGKIELVKSSESGTIFKLEFKQTK